MNPNEAPTFEVVQPSAIEAVSRAEIDVAVSTAKKYPRDIQKAKTSMMSFATLDAETAEACFYSLPRGGKNIQGPSVRLAEIAVSCYGNLRAGSRIIEVVASGDAPHVVVQAVAMDIEKNISISIEKRRRITKKKFKEAIDEDDINLAANACTAICFRDAVFKVIPLALIKPVFEAAKKVAVGDAKTLGDRRMKCLETFAKMGLPKERVLAKVECRVVDQVTLEHLETLMGLYNAIRDGEVNIDEAFPTVAAVPATTPFQQAQQQAAAAPATTPAVPAQPVTTPAAAEPAPAPAQQPRRGRPPGKKADPHKIEKLTEREAAELRAQGIAVAPEAVEGYKAPTEEQKQPEAKQEGTLNSQEEAELAAAGLAPDPEPEKPATPAAEPPKNEPEFKAVLGESAAVTEIRRLCSVAGVTEDQVMKFMSVNKLSAGEVKLTDFTANSRESKLQALAKTWSIVLPRIKAQP